MNSKKWSIFYCTLLFATAIFQVSNNTVQTESTLETINLDGIENKDYTTNNIIILSDLIDPFFRLDAMCTYEIQGHLDCLIEIQQQLEEINIALDIEAMSWSDFVYQIIADREFDLSLLELSGGYSPDYRGAYDENGSLNIFGYHTSMDYNETLGTGLNEWYLQEGPMIMPPDGEERVEHYFNWQQYLMDEILPTIPLFNTRDYEISWSNLNGYNPDKELLQSWGNMSWTGTHDGQNSTSEIVIEDYFWTELNPLWEDEGASAFIQEACMDPLVKMDHDGQYYPHIFSSFYHVNDTHVRFFIRDGIKWQTDPDGLFPNEYLDVEDVYFTLYSWATVSYDVANYQPIEKMEVIDDYTIDLFFDEDPVTVENEPFDYLPLLEVLVLPEHYLNQTQEPDGITPDITHTSWLTFNQSCFGTGLFEIDDYEIDEATNLTVWDECWWLNTSISKWKLDWENRYGDFSGGLTDLRVLCLGDAFDNQYEKLHYFENGWVDLIEITDLNLRKEIFSSNSDYNMYSTVNLPHLSLYFNGRETRSTPLQSSGPCPYNENITKGLAIRKAIAYAINRTAFNEKLHYGERALNDYPINLKSTKWLNPDIIKYDCNLTKAKEYMTNAGYEVGIDNDGDGLTDITELETTLTDRFDIDTDDDSLCDGDEVNIYTTDPLVPDYSLDSDTDGLTNVEEVDLYLTDPFDEDTDDDGMDDFWEVDSGTNPIVVDSHLDPDFDGLLSINEYNLGSEPLNFDTDSDGIGDGEEVFPGADNYVTDPLDNDSDDDTILDGEEVILGSDGYATDPSDDDTDGDGILDGEEIVDGTDGYSTDPTDADTDEDGIDDDVEIANGTDPTDANDPPVITPTPTPTNTTTVTTEEGNFSVFYFIPVLCISMIALIIVRKNRK